MTKAKYNETRVTYAAVSGYFISFTNNARYSLLFAFVQCRLAGNVRIRFMFAVVIPIPIMFDVSAVAN